MHEKACSIVVDLGSIGRGRNVLNGGLSEAESAAIDELMDTAPGRTSPYNRQLRTGRIIRRWFRVPDEHAFELAVGLFKVIMGEGQANA